MNVTTYLKSATLLLGTVSLLTLTACDAAKTSALKRLDGWIKAARRVIEGSAAQNKADLLAEFDQHAEKLREGDTGDGYAKAGQQKNNQLVYDWLNPAKNPNATGVVLWGADPTKTDKSYQGDRFGDVYANGKKVANVYDDYDQAT